MMPFDKYEGGGRKLLGKRKGGTCRDGYCLELQRKTGQTRCAYCGVSLVDDYYHWLLMSVDHAIPKEEAKRLGIPENLFEDFTNLVLACSGCNGFKNHYEVEMEPRIHWNEKDFFDLRDQVFSKRMEICRERREKEEEFFTSRIQAMGNDI